MTDCREHVYQNSGNPALLGFVFPNSRLLLRFNTQDTGEGLLMKNVYKVLVAWADGAFSLWKLRCLLKNEYPAGSTALSKQADHGLSQSARQRRAAQAQTLTEASP